MLTEQSPRAVVCMTTYNRIDCARINQEIIKLNYSHPFPIVHACSSSSYDKYLEDVLVPCEQPSLQASRVSEIERIGILQRGALNLLQKSIAVAQKVFSPKYIIHLEGDTWIMKERIIHDILAKMDRQEQLMLCTSAWDEDLLAFEYLKRPSVRLQLQIWFAALARRFGLPYRLACRDSLSIQFFVVRAIPEVMECFRSLEPIRGLDLEQALYRCFMSRFGEQNLLRQRMREPIHPFNRYVCERLSLFSQHWPARGTANDLRDPTHPRYVSPTVDGKYETLRRFPAIRRGEYIRKLLDAQTFDYYNPGASRT